MGTWPSATAERLAALPAQRTAAGLSASSDSPANLVNPVSPELQRAVDQHSRRLQRCETALGLLDPRLVLQRGYVLLTNAQRPTPNAQRQAITHAHQVTPGQALRVTLADGELGLMVDG